ncbi:hypothetical protein EOPP23_10250 [Endozoicomonas sp. OPT23]|uniref:hypothetical protein n=1 Tax=Endozoicomonas sp. OPT23 TaxID=2072845 RepID=UPI00129B72A3|nr:hypothetical protein [Endozoicomonas sp. OPT23]MRI33365.1 hypothetical protein [Endozoicomonas sp. OPT23]
MKRVLLLSVLFIQLIAPQAKAVSLTASPTPQANIYIDLFLVSLAVLQSLERDPSPVEIQYPDPISYTIELSSEEFENSQPVYIWTQLPSPPGPEDIKKLKENNCSSSGSFVGCKTEVEESYIRINLPSAPFCANQLIQFDSHSYLMAYDPESYSKASGYSKSKVRFSETYEWGEEFFNPRAQSFELNMLTIRQTGGEERGDDDPNRRPKNPFPSFLPKMDFAFLSDLELKAMVEQAFKNGDLRDQALRNVFAASNGIDSGELNQWYWRQEYLRQLSDNQRPRAGSTGSVSRERVSGVWVHRRERSSSSPYRASRHSGSPSGSFTPPSTLSTEFSSLTNQACQFQSPAITSNEPELPLVSDVDKEGYDRHGWSPTSDGDVDDDELEDEEL